MTHLALTSLTQLTATGCGAGLVDLAGILLLAFLTCLLTFAAAVLFAVRLARGEQRDTRVLVWGVMVPVGLGLTYANTAFGLRLGLVQGVAGGLPALGVSLLLLAVSAWWFVRGRARRGPAPTRTGPRTPRAC